jgi:hypothetical protein
MIQYIIDFFGLMVLWNIFFLTVSEILYQKFDLVIY